jgi:hypothetical protein
MRKVKASRVWMTHIRSRDKRAYGTVLGDALDQRSHPFFYPPRKKKFPKVPRAIRRGKKGYR